MKMALAYCSHAFVLCGLLYIVLYTLLPEWIPHWVSFTPRVSIFILLVWGIHLPYYLNRFTKK